YPGEQFQQATAHIRYRARHSRLCRRGRGSINDRLTHDEAPVAGICERTPVPTGASSHPPPGTPLMIRSQHPSTNRDSMPRNDLGTAVSAVGTYGASAFLISRVTAGIARLTVGWGV